MLASRRLKYRDYSTPGLSFVTVCSDFKQYTFGNVVHMKVELSPLGQIVEEAWLALSSRIFGIQLHAHIVMPNHIHGIVEIVHQELARSFKADVTRRAGVELEWKKEIWRHNYFDRVIRDGREFANASRYMAENPMRWQVQGQRMKGDEEARRAQQAAPLQRGRA